jgi:hypothetical protein
MASIWRKYVVPGVSDTPENEDVVFQLSPLAICAPVTVEDVLRYAVKALSTVSVPDSESAFATKAVRATASRQERARFIG